jgi:hypothetical protein
MSVPANAMGTAVSSGVVTACGVAVGGSLTGVTVIVNVREKALFWACPSLAVTVIVTVPLALATGW